MDALKLRRLESSVRILRGLCAMAVVAFGCSIGFVVFALSVPQKRALKVMEKERDLTLERARVAQAEIDHRRIEWNALKDDPSYLEVHARDRLDYYNEGEKVLRLKRGR